MKIKSIYLAIKLTHIQSTKEFRAKHNKSIRDNTKHNDTITNTIDAHEIADTCKQ